MKIAVLGFNEKKEILACVEKIQEITKRLSIICDTFIYSKKEFELYDLLSKSKKEINEYDIALSVGGDGTFLYTSRIFAGTEIPILGINLSNLGFHTNININDVENYLKDILENNFTFHYKSMIDITIDKSETFSVLNEGVISHTGISRMIRLKVDVDGHTVSDFKGDGLIISSPTGSTAYNLSAGGPILYPSLEAFVLTPICAHTLAIRPIIIPFNEDIHVSIKESSAQPQITLDGHKVILLDQDQIITFRKSKKKIKVINTNRTFSDILKQKLGWTL